MATVSNKLVIEADPKQPVVEIGNIITAFLQMWPGSEVLILQGVRTEIDKALEQISSAKQPNPPDQVEATIPNRKDRRKQKSNRR